ncbi:DNA polymerase I [Entamoeba marina]
MVIKKELDKVPSFRRSLSVTDEIKIVYVADLCKNDMGLLEKLKNEQQLIGIYVDVNNEFIGRRFKGICIGTKQWGYYIKYHSPCGNDCLFQTTFFPLIMNNTSNKSFVTFDAKQLYVQMLLTNNSILSSQHIHDVLLDYWAVHATSLTNNRRVELSINIIREAYKEKLTMMLKKDYGHETLVISSYRNILESYEHCLVVLGLSELLSNDISSLQYNKFYKEIDCPLTPIISKIEVTGIAFDIRKCKEIAQDVNKEMEVLKQKIFSICGPHFNFESSTELYNYFFEKHDFTYPTKIHEYKAKEIRLGEFKINSITELVHYAEEEARKENNQNNIVRIHCKYSQVKKTSGWLTTQTPNLMNILRTYNFLTKDKNITIQSCFCAKTNHVLVSVDLKQLLPRVLIQKSGIIEALDTPNVTISHYKQEVIQQIFSIIIHHTKKRIVARRLKTSKQEVKRLYEQFRKTFPQIIRYIKNETIESINHRIRQLTSQKKNSMWFKEEKYLQHQIIDTTIIASSAELYKQTLLQLSTHLKNYQSTIALLLYDEILFEVQEEDIMEISKIIKEVVKTSMESTLKMEIIIKQGKDGMI